MPDYVPPPTLPDEANPLTEEHYNRINEILQSCKNTEALSKACEYCNLDVGNVPDQNNAQAEICRKIKQVFFPTKI